MKTVRKISFALIALALLVTLTSCGGDPTKWKALKDPTKLNGTYVATYESEEGYYDITTTVSLTFTKGGDVTQKVEVKCKQYSQLNETTTHTYTASEFTSAFAGATWQINGDKSAIKCTDEGETLTFKKVEA